MDVLVQPIKQIVEVTDNGGTVEVRSVKNVVDVSAPGPQGIQGPTGPQGPSGSNDIGGYPVQITNATENDTIIFQSQKWVNTPESNLTDGGNF